MTNIPVIKVDTATEGSKAAAVRANVAADRAEAAIASLPDHLDTEDGAIAALLSNPASQSGAGLSAAIAEGVAANMSGDGAFAQAMGLRGVQERTVAREQCAARAAAATEISEAWANQSAWTTPQTWNVTGGRMYGTGGGGAAGGTRPFALGTTGVGMFQVMVHLPMGTPLLDNSGILVGVSKDAAGATPAIGGGNVKGLFFRGPVAGQVGGRVSSHNNGAGGALLHNGEGYAAGTSYLVTFVINEKYISAFAAEVGGSRYFRQRYDRGTDPINSIFVFNNESLGTGTGSSVGRLVAINRLTWPSAAGRAGVTDQGRSIIWTARADDSARFLIIVPPTYDPKVGAPLVVMCHGHGSNEESWLTNANNRAVADAFTAAGYIVVAGGHKTNTTTWSAELGLLVIDDAHKLALVTFAFNVSREGIYGNSMGGNEACNILNGTRLPGVSFLILTVPAVSLAAAYAKVDFKASITAAYGLAGDGSDYATKTAGHDPALYRGGRLRSLPTWVGIATDDPVIPPADHWDKLDAKVAGASWAYTRKNFTGAHSSPQIAASAGEMVAFANAY